MFLHQVVSSAVERITEDGVIYKDGHSEKFDTIVLATGYRSNVLDWLEVCIWVCI
jgi:indole-3-pyruvate monooxygenase